MCITETFHITYHDSSYTHNMNIYHDMTSHILLTCKSHTNYKVRMQAIITNCIWRGISYVVEGSYDNSDFSEAITIWSLIFRKLKNRVKTVTMYVTWIKLIYVNRKLYYIISYHKHLYHGISLYCLYCTSLHITDLGLKHGNLKMNQCKIIAQETTISLPEFVDIFRFFVCGQSPIWNKYQQNTELSTFVAISHV